MKYSDSVKEIANALAMAQAAMTHVSKDAANPFFKSRYATLASVVDAIKPALGAHGIAYVQTPVTNDKEECGVQTMLLHASGEWLLADPFFVPVTKADAQGFGSALTYCRRYSLAAVCGVAPDDDDGNAAAAAKPSRPNTATQVAGDAFDALSDEMKDWISSHAKEIIRLFSSGGDVIGYIDKQDFDNESRLALWFKLPSDVRSAIKRAQKEMRAPHTAPHTDGAFA